MKKMNDKTMMKAVVLLSGGQDSTTVLYKAKQENDQVFAITFSYGQRHAQELEVARQIAKDAKVPIQVIEIPGLAQLVESSLLQHDTEVDKANYSTPTPNTFVPGRNLLFLTYAYMYAYTLQGDKIYIGVSAADYSGYPDCRQDFINSFAQTATLATERHIQLVTPLMNLDKSQVWNMANELGILHLVKTQTLTCYNGIIGDGCGDCPACVLRKKGYEKFIAN